MSDDIRLSQGAKIVEHIASASVIAVRSMTDAELREARAYVRQLSTTNCWWATFWLGEGVRRLVDAEIEARAVATKREAVAAAYADSRPPLPTGGETR